MLDAHGCSGGCGCSEGSTLEGCLCHQNSPVFSWLLSMS
jgi:hypothetical protein